MSTKPKSPWLNPNSAPKDGTLILGDFGFPWALPAIYSPASESWCYATVQADSLCVTLDVWLETDHEPHSALKQWMPMPKLPTKTKK